MKAITRIRLVKSIPGVAMLGWMLTALFQNLPLPGSGPVHFSITGAADRWGNPWEAVGVMLAALVGLLIAAAVSEPGTSGRKAGARGLVLDLVLALLGTVFTSYVYTVGQTDTFTILPWAAMISVLLGPGLAYIIGRFIKEVEPAGKVGEVAPHLVRELTLKPGWVYWESQNPMWFNLILVVAVVAAGFAAFQTADRGLAWTLFLSLLALVPVVFIGGLRITVTGKQLTLRLGYIGLRILRLAPEQIKEVQVHSFSPLRDFGGWGIRVNTRTTGYFLRGNRGVLINTGKTRTTLLGSDDPERLAAIISAFQASSRG